MLLAPVIKGTPGPEGRPYPALAGRTRFIAAARLAEECAHLRAKRFLVAGWSPAPLARGRLREAIDEAVEGALAMRGAPPPCVSVEVDVEASIRDQVARARALGLDGLALALPRLDSATCDRGELAPSDSTVLGAWMEATHEAPIELLLDETDRSVRIVTPVPLSRLVGTSPQEREEREHPGGHEAHEARDIAASEPTELAAPVKALVMSPSIEQRPYEAMGDMSGATEVIQINVKVSELESPIEEREAPAPRPRLGRLRVSVPIARAAAEESLVPSTDASGLSPQVEKLRVSPSADHPTAEDHPGASSREHILSSAERRTFAMELDAARGPKPARVVDQLFTTRYVPLLAAVARGEADAAIRGVVDAWRTSFEHSYRDSFASMRVTGKRPSMVFDAPEVAAKIGRLNGARAIRLLLVDSMSFDLGERVMVRLKERTSGSAVCVERSLLWSALPAITSQQMALLARGAEGLRDATPSSEPEAEIARGRAVTTLRRERIGGREVMKLDCVEARLRTAGPPYEERLNGIADEVAQIVARFMETLQPRTLLFLFGDHGFRLMSAGDGASTGAATQGGASPEEVLVPGYAWLAGGVH